MDTRELHDAAIDMLKKISVRRGQDTWPLVETVNVVQEGNFTVVTLNGKYTGVAKFNPRDVVRHEQYIGNGNYLITEKSKYSSVAGLKKAMHRAAVKMF